MKIMKFYIAAFVLFVSTVSGVFAMDKARQESLLGLHYLPVTYRAISQLTWKFGLHDVSDDKAIDAYMAITNCPLYRTYFDNDFLWQRIREGARREVKFYSPKFPDRFEMTGGLELGRYDFQKSAFIIPSEYQLNRAGNLAVSLGDAHVSDCAVRRYAKMFPPTIKLAADNPFSLFEIPVPPKEAKALISRLEKYRYKNIRNKRMAFMRVRVRMTDISRHKTTGSFPELTFKGQLDDISVFEDPQMTRLIWSKTFKVLD